MALLHYANLGVPDPSRVLDQAFYGLGDFHRFLKHSIRNLERPEAVKRVGWRKAARNSDASGLWVELTPPKRNPEEPDHTFDQFLSEDVREVYVANHGSNPQDKRVKFDQRISVVDRDFARRMLCLESRPEGELLLRPNTYTLVKQLAAVEALQNEPGRDHLPLLRLLDRRNFARWPQPDTGSQVLGWHVLTDARRSGTHEQRRFVTLALQTPDFAFLEGPPGSGKTTAICELVLQLVGQGKRVLLCGSTHVAVDNVLERLAPHAEREGSDLVPVRIGDAGKVSPRARHFHLQRLAETERARLVEFLRKKDPSSAAQKHMLRCCSTRGEQPGEGFERLILDCANLVCGTTTGILQHPDIKAARSACAGLFDVLILDEASKTTFHEFLVPALFAKRWVIVGDVKQLSPYVDNEQLEANLAASLPDALWSQALIDGFVTHRNRWATVISTRNPRVLDVYRQALVDDLDVASAEDHEAPLAHVVIGTLEQLSLNRDRLPADIGHVRGVVDDTVLARVAANHPDAAEPQRWEAELAWRMGMLFGLRHTKSHLAERLRGEIDELLPRRDADRDPLHRIERVALPSVLESLQHGFGTRVTSGNDTALTHGIPEAEFNRRHVRLTYQHRMHPEIAALPRAHVYNNEALLDAAGLERDRHWTYPKYASRAVWLQVAGECSKRNENVREVEAAVRELRSFVAWAARNPNPTGAAWSVAMLTFYRGQERLLRSRLREETDDRSGYGEFHYAVPRAAPVRVELCTVDRFQGHEADFVILSIVKNRPTSFLESPNRMNVALTRARFQRVVIGDRHPFRGRAGTLLYALATQEAFEFEFREES